MVISIEPSVLLASRKSGPSGALANFQKRIDGFEGMRFAGGICTNHHIDAGAEIQAGCLVEGRELGQG